MAWTVTVSLPRGPPPTPSCFTLHRPPNPNPKIILGSPRERIPNPKSNCQNGEFGLDLFPRTGVMSYHLSSSRLTSLSSVSNPSTDRKSPPTSPKSLSHAGGPLWRIQYLHFLEGLLGNCANATLSGPNVQFKRVFLTSMNASFVRCHFPSRSSCS